MNREKTAWRSAIDEHALKALLEQNNDELHRAFEANFGLKRGAVHYYAIKKAVHALFEAEKKPLEEIVRSLCEIPMRPDVMRAIVPHITVYETYFFRHPEHFAWLRDTFLPELEQRKRTEGKRSITCWSAGCSTGEEAYSLAMTLFEYFGAQSGWDIRVLATDINHASLEIARQGCYGDWSFRDTPPALKARFFEPCTQSAEPVPGLPRLTRYRVEGRIRRMIVFAELNLHAPQWDMSTLSDRPFDLIFCRNVLIYLQKDAAKALVARFAEQMEPKGVLIVGPSEPWLLDTALFIPQHIPNGTIFVKKEPPQSPAQVEAAVQLPKPLPQIQTSTAPAPSTSEHFLSQQTSILTDKKASSPHAVNPRAEAIANARHLADSGDATRAIELCSKLLEEETTDPELYYLRGIAHLHARNLPSAESDLKKSLFLEPDNIVAHIALASIAKARGDEREMKKHYSNALYFLSKIKESEIVPGSEGIPAKAMRDMIVSLMAE
jgi:chemotaxis protein methyltransferase CheR